MRSSPACTWESVTRPLQPYHQSQPDMSVQALFQRHLCLQKFKVQLPVPCTPLMLPALSAMGLLLLLECASFAPLQCLLLSLVATEEVGLLR